MTSSLRSARAPFLPQDVWRITAITDPVAHPDGSLVAYVVRTMVHERDVYRAEIRVVDWEGRDEHVVSLDAAPAEAPLWSPDGRHLLVLGRRTDDACRQLYLLPTGIGAARRLTDGRGGVLSATWSYDGRFVAFLAPVDPNHVAHGASYADDVELLEQALWREDGIGSFSHRRAHLFVVPVSGDTPRQLTAGDYSVQNYCFSADGAQIYYIATPDPSDDWASALQSEIFVVDRASGRTERITTFGGAFSAVRPLPDGALLAIGSNLEYGEASPSLLWRIDPHSGEVVNLLPGFDYSVADSLFCDVRSPSRSHDPWIAPDGMTARVRVTHGGAVRLVEVALAEGVVRWLTPADMSVLTWHSTPDGRRRVELRTTMSSPPELWAIEADGPARQLTRLNDALLAERAVYTPQPVPFVASDGIAIDAWVILPEREEGTPIPVVVAIHGGPKRGTYGAAFMLEFHMLAGAGMAVAYCNYRGSDGYGTAFAHAIYGRRDDRDARDQLEFVDQIMGLGLGLDPGRIAVNGGGYGGFVSNWLISQDPRFKAAISQRSISNWTSLYGASPIGFHMAPQHLGCLPWEDPEHYRLKSPLTHAPQIHTPLLLIHGEQDLRCTIEQAEQLFTWLHRLGRTVRLARFPGEGHGMTRTGTPRHRAENLRLILAWLEEWL